MIRVGFVLERHGWMGGVNYYRNLFSALTLLPTRKLHLVIFVGSHVPQEILSNFSHAEVIRTPILDAGKPIGYLRRLLDRLTGRSDPLLRNLLVRNRIDVLSHSTELTKGGPFKVIGWIPDFQHVHLAKFFSSKECRRRDTDFRRMLENCDRVILSSETARSDLAVFSPAAIPKSRILRFVPEVNNKLELSTIEVLERKYEFTSPYFYVPNQFWIHKNHKVVLEALVELKDKAVEPTVLFSGSTDDYRHPAHFSRLMARINETGLVRTVKVLGVIPYNDLLSLMHHSIAVVNPSLFEGWSSTVEEAKALGKKVILSKLRVHIEQNPPAAAFFDPDDPHELAEKMRCLLDSVEQDKSRPSFFSFSESYHASRVAFAEHYQEIVEETVSESCSRRSR